MNGKATTRGVFKVCVVFLLVTPSILTIMLNPIEKVAVLHSSSIPIGIGFTEIPAYHQFEGSFVILDIYIITL